MLPEIVVQGDVCSGVEAAETSPGAGSILDEAFTNAERVLTLEKSYPYRFSYAVTKMLMGTGRQVLQRWTDTIHR
jgi:hypothetical protein